MERSIKKGLFSNIKKIIYLFIKAKTLISCFTYTRRENKQQDYNLRNISWRGEFPPPWPEEGTYRHDENRNKYVHLEDRCTYSLQSIKKNQKDFWLWELNSLHFQQSTERIWTNYCNVLLLMKNRSLLMGTHWHSVLSAMKTFPQRTHREFPQRICARTFPLAQDMGQLIFF